MADNQIAADISHVQASSVTFAPAGVRLVCPPGVSILDIAMGAGYFPKHSCRRGECQSCSAPLIEGAVHYPKGFEPSGMVPGHCLTCVAMPSGDIVVHAPEVPLEPGQRISQFGARVVSADRVSSDVTIVTLQAPASAGFSFVAGQYVDVILRDGSRRSYSMANIPDSSGLIEWHVRVMPGGRFSQHVYQTLKVRDLLRVEGPFGSFRLSAASCPVILLASGTGYAPIAAMLKSHGAELAARGGHLYWGARRREDIYAWDEVLALCEQVGNLRFVPVLSEPEPDWQGRCGLVHEAVLHDFQDMASVEVYACGNPLMVDAARTSFVERAALPESVFFSDAFVTAPSVPPVVA